MKLPVLLLAAPLFAAIAYAQVPAGPVASFTATTDNVASAHDSIRIDVLRWSTDAERDQLLDAWNLKAPAAAQAAAPGAARGGRGGRGAAAPDPAPDPGLADADATAAPAGGAAAPAGAAAGGRGGRAGGGGGRGAGGGGRGGRGAANGGAGSEAAPRTPENSLAAELGKTPTVGYLWSSEVAGYSIRYAAKIAEVDGNQRIVLLTDRRLGSTNDLWKPAAVAPTAGTGPAYEFSLIELHVNAKGEGEGKASLTGKVAVNNDTKTILLDDYGNLPVVFAKVKQAAR